MKAREGSSLSLSLLSWVLSTSEGGRCERGWTSQQSSISGTSFFLAICSTSSCTTVFVGEKKLGNKVEEGGTVWVTDEKGERACGCGEYFSSSMAFLPPSLFPPALTGCFEGLRFPDAARPSPAVQARTLHGDPSTRIANSALNVVAVGVPKLPVR